MYAKTGSGEECARDAHHSATLTDKELTRGTAACVICGKDREARSLLTNIERSEDSYGVYYCTHCHVGFTVPFPSHDVLSRLYSSGNYRSNDGTRFNSFAESLVRYFNYDKKRKIAKYRVQKGALLDIGCGRGLFLDIMKKDGWAATGVEFNEETASYAKTVYGIDVITAQAMANLPDGSFDVITLYHVLEHLQDPAAVLNTCRRLLKKQGLLVVAVPNLASPQAVFGKKHWFHLDIPYHLHHFTLRGLRQLLHDNAMKIVEVKQFDFEQNVFGWLQTLLNLSGIKNNLLYNLLKQPELRKNELRTARRRDLLFTLLLTPVYVPLSMLFSLFESLILRRGGTIHVYAIKQ